MVNASPQLVSYIAPAAPATRRPADGGEPFVRPEFGFTPKWYRKALGIDFSERWHVDPAYRRETVLAMRAELRNRFPDTQIGGIHHPDSPLDLVTGVYGGCFIAGLYGVPIRYAKDNWPVCEHQYLSVDEILVLEPPNLDEDPLFQQFMEQVDWIEENEGRLEGYMNWQGILNIAQRLRGEEIFLDVLEDADRCRRLFDCICTTMLDAATRFHQRQRASGVDIQFMTVSNCLVNMVSPNQYRELLLPYDRRMAEAFDCIGIHNCAWNADPYIQDYATVPRLGYIDMGLESDLQQARTLCPDARRALMYTPMDLADRTPDRIRADLQRLAREYAPCDIVFADIEHGTPDERILFVIEECRRISQQHES